MSNFQKNKRFGGEGGFERLRPVRRNQGQEALEREQEKRRMRRMMRPMVEESLDEEIYPEFDSSFNEASLP